MGNYSGRAQVALDQLPTYCIHTILLINCANTGLIKERSCHLQLKGKRMVFSEVEFQRKCIKQLIWKELTYKSEISLFGCLPNNPLIVVYNL